MAHKDLDYTKIHLVHNPTAGKEEYSQREILEFLAKGHQDVRYVSTDFPGWEKFLEEDPDLIIVAGGDGTVHKLAGVLWNEKGKKVFPPIRVLPTGTANNIARTLGVSMEVHPEEITRKAEPVFFDIGLVKGLSQRQIFLEAAGFGLFPKLMAHREGKQDEAKTSEGELLQILEDLRKIVMDFPARKAEIIADTTEIKGEFLLVELMNIRSIGPNLEFAPSAEPGDGHFDLVMIPEDGRDHLVKYLTQRIDGKEGIEELTSVIRSRKVKKVEMEWEGKEIHIDDDLLPELKGKKIKLEMAPGALRFLK